MRNGQNVETEVANISALSNELQLGISLYDADEAVEKLKTWHEDAENVGLETVQQERFAWRQRWRYETRGGRF